MKVKITLWLVATLMISCSSSPPSDNELQIGSTTSADTFSLKKSSLYSPPSNSSKIIETDHHKSPGIPKTIQQAPRQNVQLTQVTNAINSSYIDSQVRWGGIIRSLQNIKGSTLIRVLAYQLDDRGRPQTDTPPLGSFLAQANIPFDTATYAKGRKITVAGTVATLAQQVAAEKRFTLPLVKTEDVYVWGESTPQSQGTVTLPQYSHNSRCHYTYEGRCYTYSPHHPRPWFSSSGYRYKYRYRYRDPWYGYWPLWYDRHRDSWYRYGWPRSYIHFGFYSD